MLDEITGINRSHNSFVAYAEKPNTFLGDVQDDEKNEKVEWIMAGDEGE